jgi:hypothetical protein
MGIPDVNGGPKVTRFFLSASGKMEWGANTIYRPYPDYSAAENKNEAMEAMAYIIRETYKNKENIRFELWEEKEPQMYSRTMVNGLPVSDESVVRDKVKEREKRSRRKNADMEFGR